MNRRRLILLPLTYALVSALLSQSKPEIGAHSLPVLPTFEDIAGSAGVDFRHEASHTTQKYLIETMGSGVAILDYNKDGLLDLFFVNGASLSDPMQQHQRPDKARSSYWNRLYRNNGDGAFSDVTSAVGLAGHSYGMGVAVGDYDNDGYPDVYVTNFGNNILYHNNGDGTFTDVTRLARVSGGEWSASACFVDYDLDGHLDLVVSRYLSWDFARNPWCGEHRPELRMYCHPDQFPATTHLLYRNNADGTFTAASSKAGFNRAPGKGLGVAFNDFDRDGRPDLLVANDSAPQQLFRNRGDGTFSEVGVEVGVAYDEDGNTIAGMGVDFVDYDNDGWPDIFVNALALQRYGLYRNREGSFDHVSRSSGIAAATMRHSGWGTKLIDYDNDGWKDLFVGQGHVMDNIELTHPSLHYLEPLLLLKNVFGRFVNVSEESGNPFKRRLAARGVAVGDLDDDGFVDIAINSNNGGALVLQNHGGSNNHWLIVDTVGKLSNRDGIGAEVRVELESGFKQYGLVTTCGSYMSANDKRVHFGLGGGDQRIKSVQIRWPSGIVQKLEEVAVDQVLVVIEPSESTQDL